MSGTLDQKLEKSNIIKLMTHYVTPHISAHMIYNMLLLYVSVYSIDVPINFTDIMMLVCKCFDSARKALMATSEENLLIIISICVNDE